MVQGVDSGQLSWDDRMMTTSDKDAAADAKEHITNATDALRNAPAQEGDGSAHSVGRLADQVSVEIDEAKEHAVSAVDTTLQSASTAVKRAHATYQRDPKKTLAVAGAVAVGLLALVTLLRRLSR